MCIHQTQLCLRTVKRICMLFRGRWITFLPTPHTASRAVVSAGQCCRVRDGLDANTILCACDIAVNVQPVNQLLLGMSGLQSTNSSHINCSYCIIILIKQRNNIERVSSISRLTYASWSPNVFRATTNGGVPNIALIGFARWAMHAHTRVGGGTN